MEFKALQREPVEGFTVTIPNDSEIYTWQVAIFGPPDTPYQGGYFKVGGWGGGEGSTPERGRIPFGLTMIYIVVLYILTYGAMPVVYIYGLTQ